MPHSYDEEHSPSEFYYPGETNDKRFLLFSEKLKQTAIRQQSHIINPPY